MAVFIKCAGGATGVAPFGFSQVWVKTAAGAQCVYRPFSWYEHLVAFPSLSVARGTLAGAADANGNVLFAGGAASSGAPAERYTPDGVRVSLSSLSTERGSLAAAADADGNVLFAGGMTNTGQLVASVDMYSPDGVRTTLAALGTSSGERDGLAGAATSGGAIFAGGSHYSTYCAEAYRYANGVRKALGNLSVARSLLAAATDGSGNAYFGGGETASGTFSSAVDRYTPAGVRTTLSPLLTAAGELAAARAGENVVFAGGEKKSGYSAAVQWYTPAGVRASLADLSPARSQLAGATNGAGVALFTGGRAASGRGNWAEGYKSDGTKIAYTGLAYARNQHKAVAAGNGAVLIAGGYVEGSRNVYVEAFTK